MYFEKIPRENYINVQLFDKNINFCLLVVHDLTTDISFDAKKSQGIGKYL